MFTGTTHTHRISNLKLLPIPAIADIQLHIALYAAASTVLGVLSLNGVAPESQGQGGSILFTFCLCFQVRLGYRNLNMKNF